MDIIFDSVLKKPDIKKAKRIICIQPHPDDNEVGMGGIIAWFAKKGCEIHYLTITDGSLGLQNNSLTHEQLIEVRKNEAETSGRFLGATYFHYLNHKDGTLNDIPSLAAEIGEIIRTIKPDFVFTPDPWLTYEAHQDHIITGKAVAQAIIATGLYEYPLGTTTKPHNVKGVGFYYTNRPNTIIDITSTFDSKMKAIGMHKSQFDLKTLTMFSVYFKAKAKKAAKDEKFKLGGELKVLAEIHLHCFTGAEDV